MDYYALDDLGCCLICPDAYDGCLCYNCKCKKCDWYDDSGIGRPCSKCDELIEERKALQQIEKYEKNFPKTNQKNIFGGYLRKHTKQFLFYDNRKVKKK